jgi:hypothetical protein
MDSKYHWPSLLAKGSAVKIRDLVGALLLVLPPLAHAYVFLEGYEEAPTVAAALERLKARPEKHVLVYFGMSKFSEADAETRAVLTSGAVRDRWRPNYIVVNIDLYAPSKEEREVIDQVRVSWAPVLLFLDSTGRRVAYARRLFTERDALLLNDFVARREYAMSAFAKYSGQNFNYTGAGRAVSSVLVATGVERVDDRPRLRDVFAQKYERVLGEELKNLMPGKRMFKENQDWFLELDLKEGKQMQAAGKRKDGRGEMQGKGVWYVTKKGKLCLELTAGGVDENWCRHVFRVGGGYYATKDLRPDRLAYRFSLQAL